MTERLLQYIWQGRYFNKNDLKTIHNESLEIISTGVHNSNQGPDFLNARIKIGNTVFAGNIELHLLSSDWYAHRHQQDENYRNIILHVVWKHNDANNNLSIPTLELIDKVPKILLERYELLMNNTAFIACENLISTVSPIVFINWKDRLTTERLQRKTSIVFDYLKQNKFHWEESFWWLLAKNFGLPVNNEAFENIAKSLPVSILAKHKNQIHQLEALLLGQAGLLDKDFTEDYPAMLKREYLFLRNKYQLKPINNPVHFLRMRPSNFPTIRLAQLAMLIHKSLHLYSKIIESKSVKELQQLFNITANDFWHYHYLPDEPAEYKPKTIGVQMIDNILINSIIPMLFAYGIHNKDELFKNKAIDWLSELKAEKNSITKNFMLLGVANTSAFDSQALIELKTQYCDAKNCLSCAIGNFILKEQQ